MKKTDILVIDGQGGRIGAQIVEKIHGRFENCRITAVGTNTAATALMLKSGADRGATGENAVCVGCEDADVIIGPIGIVIANSLLGEITPAMAVAVGKSKAQKLLVPVNQCNNFVVGVQSLSLSTLLESTINKLDDIIKDCE